MRTQKEISFSFEFESLGQLTRIDFSTFFSTKNHYFDDFWILNLLFMGVD